ncbi:MAG: GNAT family N-acetyltransferase [Rhodobacteraceae bacterium]|nr:GNAT family N-acetyltransferase [Paracoccaceae bacterium]
MTLIIRPLEPTDALQWRGLWQGYLDYYETTLAPEIYDAAIGRMLSKDHPEYHGLVAEQDEKLVGLTHYIYHTHGWQLEDACYLQDLYADPAYRGKGIGRALIEGVYAAADKAGCPKVYWMTQDFNKAGRQLYDRIGTLTPFIKYSR